MSSSVLSNRDFYVVKSNDLIQKNRFELSLQEQKTIAYICSLIIPGTDNLSLEFSIRDYCKISGIDYNSGKNYLEIKNTLRTLSDRSMWLMQGNTEVLVRWLSKVKINKKSSKVFIDLDSDLKPYLLDLKSRFTQYQLFNILAMKSQFSIRIYEILKSYQFQKSKTYNLDDLKNILMVQDVKSYKNFKDFRKYVLEIAIREINDLTDIEINYSLGFKGKKVTEITFNIQEKTSFQKLISNTNVMENLD